MNVTRLFLTTLSIFIATLINFTSAYVTLPPPSEENNANPGQTLTNTTRSDVSRNWSGYNATGGKYTAVTGSWKVPVIQNTDTFGVEASWVGIGGVESTDLIQAGTQSIVNPNGRVSYLAFYETLPDVSRPLPITVNGGDSVSAAVIQTTEGIWKIIFTNNTTDQTVTREVKYNSSLSSAEWIEEAPSSIRRVLPLNDFGTVEFTNATALKDNQVKTISELGAQAVMMGNSMGEILATPSPVDENGHSFTVTRVNRESNSVSTHQEHYTIHLHRIFSGWSDIE